jgi:(3S)-malyl-CoA thioesterase
MSPILCRSTLYLPAANLRALDKARSLPADALIFDLEDAVAPEEKPYAREALSAALAAGGYGGRLKLVRINALDTPWGADDLAAFAGADCDALLLPKVATPADLDPLEAASTKPLWAMIETPAGVLGAAAIAAHPRLAGLVLGTNDLAKDLGARHVPGRAPLAHALQAVLLAARAAGRLALDGVFNALDDPEGLAAECAAGRDMGFDGKTLIHPGQIAAANAAFAPDAADLALAARQIAAYDAARAEGRGIAVVDGRIVEGLHIATARATLAKASLIDERTT